MSFGFSVGDFIRAITLINDIVTAVRGQADFEYRELIIELEALKRALNDIEKISTTPENEVAIKSIKVAALLCQHPLKEFDERLRSYRLLQIGALQRKRDVIIATGRKVQWNISMPEEVLKLRAYLAAHVGSLNMRLHALGLSTLHTCTEANKLRQETLQNAVEKLHVVAETSGAMTEETRSGVFNIWTLLGTTLLPQVQGLAELATKVWSSNMQIMTLLTTMNERTLPIDMRHTWFQEPLRFEDAFGRILPVPAEYSWSKIEAIILDQFACGPGHEKIFSGEYELFDSNDSTTVISSHTNTLKPGMCITMAVVIGRYEHTSKLSCPKPGCRSKEFRASKAGGSICDRCQTYFGPSKKPLPRPFRLLCSEKLEQEFDTKEQVCMPPHSNNAHRVFRQMRDERKWFKNMRIHQTDQVAALNVFEQSAKVVIQEPLVTESELDTTPTSDEIWTLFKQFFAVQLGIRIDKLPDEIVLEDLGFDWLVMQEFFASAEEGHCQIGGDFFETHLTVGDVRPPSAPKPFQRTTRTRRADSHVPLKRPSVPERRPIIYSRSVETMWGVCRTVLKEEFGWDAAEEHQLDNDHVVWADLGMDSLMALSCAGMIRERTDVSIDGFVFLDYPTIGDFRARLCQLCLQADTIVSSD